MKTKDKNEKKTNGHNESPKPCQGFKTVGSTVTGAGLGVIGGITAISAAAFGEILLPVGICLWATGVTGGAIGFLLGIPGKNKKGG